MIRLYFVRHGQSQANLDRTYAGHVDTPLTTLGEDQAKLAGIQAKTFGLNLIISSPLIRAHKTAEIIAETVGYPVDKILTDALFQERNLGSLSGKSWDEFDENDSPFTDLETEGQMILRAQEAIAYLKSLDAENILVVSHGSFGLALRAAIDPNELYPEAENAEIIQLI